MGKEMGDVGEGGPFWTKTALQLDLTLDFRFRHAGGCVRLGRLAIEHCEFKQWKVRWRRKVEE